MPAPRSPGGAGQAHTAVSLGTVAPGCMPAEDWLSAKHAAARADVTEGTWKGYVSRGRAPAPNRHPRSGRPEWLPETTEAWLAARPGPGIRTDLF
jgi:hypothetical protein